MDRKSFVLYTESREIIDKLSIEQRGILLTSLFDHVEGIQVEGLDPLTDIVFTTIRTYMDKDFSKYESRCEKNRKNANTRWNNNEGNANACNRIQSHAIAKEEKATSEPGEEKKVNEGVKKRQRKFEPPTVEEVRQYVQSKGYKVDPQRFIDYYESRGWELSKGRKVKDWQACVRTWDGNSKEWNNEKQKRTGVTISNEQRSEYVGFEDFFGDE